MKVTISFQHMKHSPATEQTILDKCQKLEKVLRGGEHLEWHCGREEGRYHLEVKLAGAAHFECHATSVGSELAGAAGEAVSKVQKQLVKRKEKMTEKIHRKSSEPEFFESPEAAWEDGEE